MTIGARRDAREPKLGHLAVERAPERIDDLCMAAAAFGRHTKTPAGDVRSLRRVHGVTVAEFLGDRICSVRQYWDEFAVLEQLGVMSGDD